MRAAKRYRRCFTSVLLTGLAAASALGTDCAAAGQSWPRAPFGTPPSFSRDYPRPLYEAGRFITLQGLLAQERVDEARLHPTPDVQSEAFAALQKFAPHLHGDVAPSDSVLAYAPAQDSPQGAAPASPPPVMPEARSSQGHHLRPKRVPHERHGLAQDIGGRDRRPAAHLTERSERRRGLLPPPLDIRPPAARRP